jgi:hypothetical protein
VKDYWDHSWPCDEMRPGYGQCVNGRGGHEHHQFPLSDTIVRDDYKTSDTLPELQKDLTSEIEKRVKELCREATADKDRLKQLGYEKCVSQAHRLNVIEFYNDMKSLRSFSSHSVCFSCLDAAPEHALPCGHVICTPCVISAASDNQQGQAPPLVGGFFLLTSCPLGEHGDPWGKPWVGCLKPEQAGVRILTLDG